MSFRYVSQEWSISICFSKKILSLFSFSTSMMFAIKMTLELSGCAMQCNCMLNSNKSLLSNNHSLWLILRYAAIVYCAHCSI